MIGTDGKLGRGAAGASSGKNICGDAARLGSGALSEWLEESAMPAWYWRIPGAGVGGGIRGFCAGAAGMSSAATAGAAGGNSGAGDGRSAAASIAIAGFGRCAGGECAAEANSGSRVFATLGASSGIATIGSGRAGERTEKLTGESCEGGVARSEPAAGIFVENAILADVSCDGAEAARTRTFGFCLNSADCGGATAITISGNATVGGRTASRPICPGFVTCLMSWLTACRTACYIGDVASRNS